MPHDLKFISVPTLLTEELIPFPHFDIRFKQAIIETGTATVEMQGAVTRMAILYPKMNVRTHSEVIKFFRDWCSLLLMDPRTEERKALHPVEYAAVIDVDGIQYYTFPASVPNHGPNGFGVLMILSPVPQVT